MALHITTSITENPPRRARGEHTHYSLLLPGTYTLLCVCVCSVTQCECCYATLIPVKALSQARGRSGSKTHKTLEVFPSNQTWTDTERAGSVPAHWYISIFLQPGGSRLAVSTGLPPPPSPPPSPSYNLCP